MNLRDLRYLVAVAEHQHFGRAAEACFVSQPTLSTQIRKLEEELGVQLVVQGSDLGFIRRGMAADINAFNQCVAGTSGAIE